MGFEPLIWYCLPLADGIWAKVTDRIFGSYTPCGIDLYLSFGSSRLVLLLNLAY